MSVPEVTRRTVLQSVVPLGLYTAGCLESEPDAYERATPDIDPGDASARPPASVSIAHWFGAGTLEPLEAQLDHRKSPIDWTPFPSRESLETSVASAMNQGSPPDVVQTVLGAELARYVTAVTVDEVDDIFEAPPDGQLLAEARALSEIDGHPYAVPLTVSPLNGLLAHRDRLRTVGVSVTDLRDPYALVEALEQLVAAGFGGLGLRRTGGARLQLLGQLLLGATDIGTYEGIATGDLHLRTLREVVSLFEHVLALTHDLPDRARFETVETAGCVLFDARSADLLRAPEWIAVPFPGTSRAAVVDVQGFVLPKRASNPIGAVAILEAMTDPDVQRDIAKNVRRLPAILARSPTDPVLQKLDDWVGTADRVLPAMSTGCGLDSTARWLAVNRLEPGSIEQPDANSLAEDLHEIFP